MMPIIDYDERYFADCNYTREELSELQNDILAVISSGSTDIRKDLKTKIVDKEIDLCLRICYSKRLVKRERLGAESDVPIYRYFT